MLALVACRLEQPRLFLFEGAPRRVQLRHSQLCLGVAILLDLRKVDAT